jgi:hypothetical protein
VKPLVKLTTLGGLVLGLGAIALAFGGIGLPAAVLGALAGATLVSGALIQTYH